MREIASPRFLIKKGGGSLAHSKKLSRISLPMEPIQICIQARVEYPSTKKGVKALEKRLNSLTKSLGPLALRLELTTEGNLSSGGIQKTSQGSYFDT